MKIEKEITFAELARVLNMKDDTPEIYDITGMGLEVESFNTQTCQREYKPVTEVLIKPSVDYHYELNGLKATSKHRVLSGDTFISMEEHPDAVRVNEKISVMDISVEDNENYVANEYVNHNTTSGGKYLLPL